MEDIWKERFNLHSIQSKEFYNDRLWAECVGRFLNTFDFITLPNDFYDCSYYVFSSSIVLTIGSHNLFFYTPLNVKRFIHIETTLINY